MIIDSISKLHPNVIEKFYESQNSGVLILRDSKFFSKLLFVLSKEDEIQFHLKDHQEINNGQEYVVVDNEISGYLLKIYEKIQMKFPSELSTAHIEYAFTKYPISEQGAEFHIDFSYNMNFITTFFFGDTVFLIADDKSGTNKKEYQMHAGDILIMRGPQNQTDEEKSKRPIHAIREVKEILLTFEVRQVHKIKK